MSDGNGFVSRRSRCTRWISTGTARASRPTRNAGARNPIRLSAPGRSAGGVPGSGRARGRAACSSRASPSRCGSQPKRRSSAARCSATSAAVLLPHVVGHHRQSLAALEVLVAGGRIVGEVQLGRVQDLEHDHVAAPPSQQLHRAERGVRVLVEIGDEDGDAPPPARIGGLQQRPRELAPASGAPAGRARGERPRDVSPRAG